MRKLIFVNELLRNISLFETGKKFIIFQLSEPEIIRELSVIWKTDIKSVR